MAISNIKVMENGMEVGWASLRLLLFSSIPLTGIESISFGSKRTVTNEYGAGDKPIGRGLGNIEYEDVKLEVRYAEVVRIQRAAANLGLDITKIPMFSINMQIGDGLSSITQNVILKYCTFIDDMFSSKQNDTKINVTLTIKCGEIVRA